MPDENERKLTTVQIDTETRRKLGVLAVAYRRSLTDQVGMMVAVEYARLRKLNLLGREEAAVLDVATAEGSAQGKAA